MQYFTGLSNFVSDVLFPPDLQRVLLCFVEEKHKEAIMNTDVASLKALWCSFDVPLPLHLQRHYL